MTLVRRCTLMHSRRILDRCVRSFFILTRRVALANARTSCLECQSFLIFFSLYIMISNITISILKAMLINVNSILIISV
jgi:hypothetical protein